ncbi:pentapeptide repeat-containing protein [Legionella maceachernii]|uniref:pentapeptide repeat-containing protein n=1 Tax=Legionella maceachernii TaxID=466 RepID=UPI0010567827|nr:pentapeptide repeat-containing protein [Legionella maceachernii]
MSSNGKTIDNVQVQLEAIRQARHKRYVGEQTAETAKQLLSFLEGINETLIQYSFPSDRKIDLFASQQCHDQYICALIDMSSKLKAFTASYEELKGYEMQCVISAIASTHESDDTMELKRTLVSLAQRITLLGQEVELLLSEQVNARDNERRALDESIISKTNSVKENINYLFSMIKRAEVEADTQDFISTVTESVAQEETAFISKDNQAFSYLLALPVEVQQHILSNLSLRELAKVRETCKELRAIAEDVFNTRCKPSHIIAFLSQANASEGNQFVVEYQQTDCYKILKRKVFGDQQMTNEEIICYALTRDNHVLPKGIIQATKSIALDEQTKEHLKLIEQAEIASRNPNRYKSELLKIFAVHDSGKFLNLFSGITSLEFDLSHQNLAHSCLVNAVFSRSRSISNLEGANFSGANLRSARLNDCNLRGANFRGANLSQAKLNGAVLKDAILDNANLAGASLALTALINVDLRTVDLSQVNLEWTFLKNVRLVPETSIETPEALELFLREFEQRFSEHSTGSLNTLRAALLEDLAHLIDAKNISLREKLNYLEVVIAKYNHTSLTSALLPLKNPCADLYRKMTEGEDKEHSRTEHPLKAEFLGHVQSILATIENLPPVQPQSRQKTTPPVGPRTISDTISLNIKQINACLAKDPHLRNGSHVCEAFGIDEFVWHLIVHGTISHFHWPSQRPTVIDYPCSELNEKHTKRYAGEVFNGELFEVNLLRTIWPMAFETELYGEEDFIIVGENRAKTIVKLGGLLFQYGPRDIGSIEAKVDIIDFEKRQLRPGFKIDLVRYGALKIEMFMPLDPDVNYRRATSCTAKIERSHLEIIEAGYSLKRKIVEYIFATQKGRNLYLEKRQDAQLSEEKEELSGEKEVKEILSSAQSQTEAKKNINADPMLKVSSPRVVVASAGHNPHAFYHLPKTHESEDAEQRRHVRLQRGPTNAPQQAQGSCVIS